EEQGALRVLRAHAWLEGSIPADLDRIARILRVSRKDVDRLYDAIAARVDSGTPGRLVFPDLERQRKEKADYSQLQRDKANQKWEQERSKRAAAPAPAYPAAYAPAHEYDAAAPPAGDPVADAGAHAAADATALPVHMPRQCSASASSPASSEEFTQIAHMRVEPEPTVVDVEDSQLSEYEQQRSAAQRFIKLWNELAETPAPTFFNAHVMAKVAAAIQEARLAHQSAGKRFPEERELVRGLMLYAKSESEGGFRGAWSPGALVNYIPQAVLVALGELDPFKRPAKPSGKPAETKPAYHRPAKLGYSD